MSRRSPANASAPRRTTSFITVCSEESRVLVSLDKDFANTLRYAPPSDGANSNALVVDDPEPANGTAGPSEVQQAQQRVLDLLAPYRLSQSEHDDAAQASLDVMPEIDDERFRRRPGRGHHAARSVGQIVTIDADVWSHFGSERAINQALRRLLEESRGS